MDLNHIQAFVVVARSGSYTAAAKRLGTSKSTLSRHIAELEASLGARLLQRSSRSIGLTGHGRAFLERCEPLLERLEGAGDAARTRDAPHGTLRISAPISATICLMLAGLLPDFHRHFPDIELIIDTRQTLVDLVAERVDVALRAGPATDSSLVGRFLVRTELAFFASPDYLARRGTPETIEELAAHDLLLLKTERFTFDSVHDPEGKLHRLPGEPLLSANDFDPLLAAAAAGLGIALLDHVIAGGALRRGAVVELLEDYRRGGPRDGLWLLYPSRSQLDPKVAAFVDYVWTRRERLVEVL